MNDNFIQELEEEIRDERLTALWNQYGNWIIGGAVAIVIGTASVPTYRYYKNTQAETAQTQYQKAVSMMRRGKSDEALKQFEIIQEGSTGYTALSGLQEAALLTDMASNASGDEANDLMAKANAIYENIASDASNSSMAGVATILGGLRAVDSPEDRATWRVKLQSLMAPEHPWRGLALEIMGLYSLKDGKPDEAAQYYVEILKDRNISPDSLARTSMMISQVDIPESVWDALIENLKEQEKAQ